MTPYFASADVSLPSDTTVQVRRSFNAPRELVWRAHTEPALFQRWMLGPSGWTMAVCEMDVRPGGAFRCLWRSEEENNSFGVYGEYKEVTAPIHLVHTELFDPGDVGGSMQTLGLQEHDGVTTLTVLMDFHTKEARDAAVATGMTDGAEAGYARLDEILDVLQIKAPKAKTERDNQGETP